MDSKYYTPDMSEFYIGFEYEYLIDGVWKQVIVEDSEHLTYLMFDSNDKNWRNSCKDVIRVKYLDKKDIESLGFKHNFNYDGEEYPSQFDEHGCSTGYLLDTQLINNTGYFLYYFSDSFTIVDKIYKNGSIPYVFQGTIKNKSELKKLLTQLGI